ncbi:MAG: nitrilase-related carbon-nitrogen hydrolase [Rhodobacter sp.]|nr:nitrilase-related carbon-nitrogen hydrolase [Rhodobacter sp.]
MDALTRRPAVLWLVIFTVLYVFAGGRWGIPVAAWLAPVFAIRFIRDSKSGWRAFFWIWLAAAVATIIASHHTTTLHFQSELIEPALFAVMSLPILIPFVVDRLFHRRWASGGPGPFWLTFVYPISFTAMDFASAIGSPLGSWGSLAYSQAGSTVFMQLTAITGMSGITFIVSWFASVANYAWEGGFQWSKINRAVVVFAGVILIVFGYGYGRLALVEPGEQTVQVGGFSLPLREVGSMNDLWKLGAEEEYHEAFKALNRRQLAQVRVMAQDGAKIVVLQEVAVQGLQEEVAAMLENAAGIAREEGIYLALPTGTIVPDGQYENVVRIFDPNGEVVLEHYKFGGAQFEGSVPGNGVLQIVETPYGKLSAAICWDADFPDIVRQAGAQDVDLLLLPSNDWFEIREIHPGMATFRAVENGMPIFRQTGNGVSTVIDAYGRVTNRMDMHAEGDPDTWGAVQMVNVPVGSVATLYPKTGDVLGLAMVAGFFGLLAFAWIRRKPERSKSDSTTTSPPDAM